MTVRSTHGVTGMRATDWRDSAACREEDPAIFFPEGTGAPLVAEQAKAICRRCPSQWDCLQFALARPENDGIFGGLTDKERAGLRRQAARRNLTPEDIAEKADTALRPREPRTLQSIYDASTTRLYGGHVAWTGQKKIGFEGKELTPRQLCFILDRGRAPEGPVRSGCGIDGCVLPQHLADAAECGTARTKAAA